VCIIKHLNNLPVYYMPGELLKDSLKHLISVYGYIAVHSQFMELAKESRRELEELFKSTIYFDPKVVANLVLSPETTTPPKKEVKAVEPPQPPKKQVITAAEAVQQVLSMPPVKPEEVDKKTHHKMAIDKRVAELRSQGKEAPFPLLTQENMTQWIQKDGLTYWKIAEMTGATDLQVSSVAKMYKLQSNASKMIMFKKNSGN